MQDISPLNDRNSESAPQEKPARRPPRVYVSGGLRLPVVGLRTLWGRDLDNPWPSRLLAAGLLLAAVGPSVVLLAGLEQPVVAVLARLEWSPWVAAAGSALPLALLAGLAAAAALATSMLAFLRGRSAADGSRALLGPTLAAVALADATAVALLLTAPTAFAGGGLLVSWTVARSLPALALPLGAWWLASQRQGQQVAQLATLTSLSALALLLGGLALAVGRAPGLYLADAVVSRPVDLAALVLFALGGLVFFPELYRRAPGPLTYALLLSALPQILAQLHAILAADPLAPTLHGLLARYQELLAVGTLFVGLALEQRAAERQRHEAKTGQQELVRRLGERVQQVRSVRDELETEIRVRQRAERRLRMLETAVQTMSVGVTITDLEGKIVFINPADLAIHGYQREEVMGEDAGLFAARHGGSSALPDLASRDWPWKRERINRRKDGTELPVRLISDRVRDADGEAVGIVTLCEDITERVRTRTALEGRDRILEAVGLAAERFLAEASLEESVGEVLARLGEATGVDRVYLSSVQAMPGVPRSWLDHTWTAPYCRVREPRSGRSTVRFPEALFPGWRTRLAAGHTLQGRVADLVSGEKTYLLDRGVGTYAAVPIFVEEVWWGFIGLEDADGRREWSNAELEALRIAARTLAAAIYRKQAEGALAASEENYRDLLENANDLILSVTADGGFSYVNRAGEATLGYSSDELAAMSVFDIVDEGDREAFRDILRQVLQGEPVGRLETTFITRDGRDIAVEGSLNCRFLDGKPVATRGIFRDITERRQVERMKEEFLSAVSHDLRTPLSSIIASLGLLEASGENASPDRRAELVAMARRNSKRLLQLINDLLDLQRLARGKMELEQEAVPVGPFLEDALAEMEAYAGSFGVRLEADAVAPDLQVYADRRRLLQVAHNLLSNAIKFSPAEGTVTVAARAERGTVVISVTDRGPGIPDHFQERLFDKFTQLQSVQNRSVGSGLGLSIVKALVEAMGGRVSVDSTVGEGTTMSVHLPRPAVGPGAVAEPGEVEPEEGDLPVAADAPPAEPTQEADSQPASPSG
jgi:PAS domain S-box-containing protein